MILNLKDDGSIVGLTLYLDGKGWQEHNIGKALTGDTYRTYLENRKAGLHDLDYCDWREKTIADWLYSKMTQGE